jgi:hypothetical protein
MEKGSNQISVSGNSGRVLGRSRSSSSLGEISWPSVFRVGRNLLLSTVYCDYHASVSDTESQKGVLSVAWASVPVPVSLTLTGSGVEVNFGF